eukprot:jgi/Picsp_1/5785/NSC_03144-R1_---NA---
MGSQLGMMLMALFLGCLVYLTEARKMAQTWNPTVQVLGLEKNGIGRRGRSLLYEQQICVWFPKLPFCQDDSKNDARDSRDRGIEKVDGTSCPSINLNLAMVDVFHQSRNNPQVVYQVQCQNSNGQTYRPSEFLSTTDVVSRSYASKYTPGEIVAELNCGERVSCSVKYIERGVSGEELRAGMLTSGDLCQFDYRHFVQLSYREPGTVWTCSGGEIRYALQCVECEDPNFPWDLAMESSGPPLTSEDSSSFGQFNSVMVIVSVSVVAVAVLLSIVAILIRSRRRANAIDQRVSELIDYNRNNRSDSFKPPDLYVVGSTEPSPPSTQYSGPIVVFNCYDDKLSDIDRKRNSDTSDMDSEWSIPQIAIATVDQEGNSDGDSQSNEDDEKLSPPEQRHDRS